MFNCPSRYECNLRCGCRITAAMKANSRVSKKRKGDNKCNSPHQQHIVLAQAIRNGGNSIGPLTNEQGVCQMLGRRVEYFSGKSLVDCVLQSKVPGTKVEGREEARALCEAMIRSGCFHRAVISAESKKRKAGEPAELELHSKQTGFDEGSIYIWMIAPSQRRLIIQSVGFVLVSLFICLFKIWPLWLKIVLWWVSLILLIFIISSLLIRLLVSGLFWLVGFRGVWLLPNLINDELPFLECFTPLIGRGVEPAPEAKEPAKKAKKKKAGRKQADEEEPKTKDEELASSAADKPQEEAQPAQDSAKEVQEKEKLKEETEGKQRKSSLFDHYHFGLANLVMLLVLTAVALHFLGVFSTEHIPGFIATQRELYQQWPSIAPPPSPSVNDTDV